MGSKAATGFACSRGKRDKVDSAIESFKGRYSENYSTNYLPASVKASNAYVIRNGVVTTARVFSEEQGLHNMVMIDAISGEKVNMH